MPRIDPINFRERINLDRYGQDCIEIEHEAMLYGRVVMETQELSLNEYMLLSFETDNKDNSKVHIMCGVDLDKSYLMVNGMPVR